MTHAQGFADAAESAFGDVLSPGVVAPTSAATFGVAMWMDLGSGGGLPGLVLAHRWPRSEAVLLDSNERRAAFLVEVVQDLGWSDRVRVVRARAEEAGRRIDLRESFSLVVARSFGPPASTAECAAPFLVPGGILVVSEPPPDSSPSTGERWPAEVLAQLGIAPVRVWRDAFGYQVLRQVTPCPRRFPRRVGVPFKRPLYRSES